MTGRQEAQEQVSTILVPSQPNASASARPLTSTTNSGAGSPPPTHPPGSHLGLDALDAGSLEIESRVLAALAPARALANCVVNPWPSRLTSVVLTETFDPAADQQRLRACYEIVEACGRHDDPDLPGWSFGAFSAGWTHGWGTPHQAWLAHGDPGEPVGCYLLLLPDKANLTTGSCLLFIAPGSRRSGHGRRLLAHCAEQARLAGRTRLRAEVTEGGPGAWFAVSVGASIGISEVIRVLVIEEGLSARLAALRARAEEAAGGYSLVWWQGATRRNSFTRQPRSRWRCKTPRAIRAWSQIPGMLTGSGRSSSRRSRSGGGPIRSRRGMTTPARWLP